ncbi:transcription factor HES-5-like [Hyperolius riggenbachi]|uniref:transcription factor HES-5-like n=1 Tax=Hyperolius riggenbachi TaxID=752182 RepID=UPI0035A3A4BD
MAPYDRLDELDHHMGKDTRKLRKPVIEKMRRDRINSSIEQLRLLLEKEFHKHQLPSKPEKADILEMAVNLLREQLHRASKAVVPCKATFSTTTKEAEFISKNYLSTARSYWSDPNKLDSSRENPYHPLAPPNQDAKQAAQACSSADLWRPW